MQSNRWICRKCGNCCRQFRLPVKNKEELIRTFEQTFGFKLKSYEIEAVFHGECEHLKGNKCTIHDKKPKLCSEYICKKYNDLDVPEGQIYQKRCKVCQNLRKFQKGTERDKQSICGNCWEW